MPEHLRGYLQRAADKSSLKPGDAFPFVCSTDGIGRDGLVIDQSGWDLTDYIRMPTVLWSHDYLGNHPAIGRAENVRVEDGALKCDIHFDQQDEFAKLIERKYISGVLGSVSVGWDTKEFAPSDNPNFAGTVKRAALLDVSCVNIPGDPSALLERQARVMEADAKELLRVLGRSAALPPDDPNPTPDPDPAPSARATWAETAAAMVRLFHPFAQRPDTERDADYKRLQREYARHGKTPPELLPTATVDALTVDAVRAHFLEGEAELLPDVFAAMGTRAGAVLSKRSMEDIDAIEGHAKEIMARCDAMRSRAKKETEQTDEERAAEESLRLLARTFKLDKDAA